ncbi:MAG: hypothetical protein WAQ98_32455 [Blastocatellia bacterium]
MISKISRYIKYILLFGVLIGIAINVYLWGNEFVRANKEKEFTQITERADKLVATNSKECLKEAKKVYEEGLGRIGQNNVFGAILKSKIAFTNYELGDDSKAIESYKEAIDIYEKLNGDEINKKKVDALYILGALLNGDFREVEDGEEGRVYLKRALNESRAMKDTKREIKVLDALGDAYYRWKGFEASLKYDYELLGICEKAGDVAGQSKALVKIGWDYFNIYSYNTNKAFIYKKSFDYFKQAVEVAKTSKSKEAEVVALVNTGTFLTHIGDEEGSNQYYHDAEEMSKSDNELKRIVYRSLIEKYEFLKDEKEQARYKTVYKELETELEKINCLAIGK